MKHIANYVNSPRRSINWHTYILVSVRFWTKIRYIRITSVFWVLWSIHVTFKRHQNWNRCTLNIVILKSRYKKANSFSRHPISLTSYVLYENVNVYVSLCTSSNFFTQKTAAQLLVCSDTDCNKPGLKSLLTYCVYRGLPSVLKRHQFVTETTCFCLFKEFFLKF